MPNENCLKGLRCPYCGSEGPFRIACQAVVLVFDDGTDETDSVEWDDDSACTCSQCHESASVKKFTVRERKGKKNGKRVCVRKEDGRGAEAAGGGHS